MSLSVPTSLQQPDANNYILLCPLDVKALLFTRACLTLWGDKIQGARSF